MKNQEPIIVIDCDHDDQYLIGEIFLRLNCKNKIIYFDNGNQAFEYLVSSNEKPFLIFSDINMPGISGLELREKIRKNEMLGLKCIPYVFFTTSNSPKDILNAYANCVQGLFVKPHDIKKLEMTIKKILEYWQECLVPECSD